MSHCSSFELLLRSFSTNINVHVADIGAERKAAHRLKPGVKHGLRNQTLRQR
jgi:hypothetical protein